MTNFIKLIDELHQPKTLSKINREIKQYGNTAKRMTSKTAYRIIKKYYTCNVRGTSDLVCLFDYLKKSADDGEIEFKYPQAKSNAAKARALENYGQFLKKLTTVLKNMTLKETSSTTNAMTKATNILKRNWVRNHGMSTRDNEGPIPVIRRVVADTEANIVSIQRGEQRRKARLSDKYTPDWATVESFVQTWVDRYEKDMIQDGNMVFSGLALACIIACGPRIGSIAQPRIHFMTIDQYEEATGKKMGDFWIGKKSDGILVNRDEAIQKIGEKHIIVQVGKVKDANQRDNKYLDEDDERYIDPSIIIKPTLMLEAAKIVEYVYAIRNHFGLTVESTKGMDQEQVGAIIRKTKRANNKTSTWFNQLLKQAFPAEFAKSKKNRWNFSSHFCRKLYANGAVHAYKEALESLTGKTYDRSVLIAKWLGHDSGLNAHLSYANVEPNFEDVHSKQVLARPPAELLRDVLVRIERLEQENKELRTLITSNSKAHGLAQVVNRNKEVIMVPRVQKSLPPPEKYKAALKLLQEHNAKPTYVNM